MILKANDTLVTWVIASFGIMYGVYYYYRSQNEGDNSEVIRDAIYSTFENKEKPEDDLLKVILSDYASSNKEIERRENITLVIGGILLSASFYIVSSVFGDNLKPFLCLPAFSSIALFIIWTHLMHRTARDLDANSYARQRAIERYLGESYKYLFGIHYFAYNVRKKGFIEMLNDDIENYYDWGFSRSYETFKKFIFRTSFWSISLIMLGFVWMVIALIS